MQMHKKWLMLYQHKRNDDDKDIGYALWDDYGTAINVGFKILYDRFEYYFYGTKYPDRFDSRPRRADEYTEKHAYPLLVKKNDVYTMNIDRKWDTSVCNIDKLMLTVKPAYVYYNSFGTIIRYDSIVISRPAHFPDVWYAYFNGNLTWFEEKMPNTDILYYRSEIDKYHAKVIVRAIEQIGTGIGVNAHKHTIEYNGIKFDIIFTNKKYHVVLNGQVIYLSDCFSNIIDVLSKINLGIDMLWASTPSERYTTDPYRINVYPSTNSSTEESRSFTNHIKESHERQGYL